MNLIASFYLFFAIATHCLLHCIEGLRITKITVPSVASIGEMIWLNCSYDLESDSLYSIKWYKDSEEMYRFVPSNSPPIMTYDVTGLKMLPSYSSSSFWSSSSSSSSLLANFNSSGGCIRVTVSTTDATGEFRCEVSAEAPSFQTSKRSTLLTVTSGSGSSETLVSKVKSKDHLNSSSSHGNDLISDGSSEYFTRNNHFHTQQVNGETNIKKHFVNDLNTSLSDTSTNAATLLESVNQIFTGLSCCFKLIMGMSLVLGTCTVILLLIKMYPCINCYCRRKNSKRTRSSLNDITATISAASSPLTSASQSLSQSTQFK